MKGSSPLARGLRGRRIFQSSRLRIIPARAGFTQWIGTENVPLTDHPRSRGVYVPHCVVLGTGRGSSPLARGLHLAILGIPTITHPTRRLPPSLLT